MFIWDYNGFKAIYVATIQIYAPAENGFPDLISLGKVSGPVCIFASFDFFHNNCL